MSDRHEAAGEDVRQDRAEASTPQEQDHDALANQPPDERRDPPAKPPWMAMLVAVVLIAGLLGFGFYSHYRRNSQAADTQQQATDFVPTVRVVEVKREDNPMETTLPGQTEAFQTAMIFSRATGYVAERNVDIGSRVKKGDLLVRIAAPDVDDQLAQAVAQLGQTAAAVLQAQAQVTQAKSSLALQTTNLQRSNVLTRQGYETAQNQQTQQTTVESQQAALTTAEAGVKVSEANLKAQQATVDRLRALTAFERVVAPFDGVVTQRNVEVGNLVNADNGTGTPLFRVDEDDVLRVAVSVPQYSSDGIRDGLDAKVTAPQIPDRVFTGKVARTSVALLYSSRTLTTEVDVLNPNGTLRPGQFVDVAIEIPRTTPVVSVPADALIFNQHGMQVATLEQDDKVKFRKIDIYRDLGTSVELKNGLNGGEKVVLGAPADLLDGGRVKVAPPAEKDKDAPKTASNAK